MSTSVKTTWSRGQKPTPSRRRVPYAAVPLKVLIAVDGSRASNAALRFARRMAELNRWTPHAITVAQPVPIYLGEIMTPVPLPVTDVIMTSALLALRSQLRRHGVPTWHTCVRFGPTGWSILESAHQFGSRLIVIGLGKHGKLGRFFGAETANRVARHSDIPMLAVHARARELPRVVVAGVDFGPSSDRAIREAVELLEQDGQLHLVHVMSSTNYTPMDDVAWRLSYAQAVEKSFAALLDRLHPAVTVKTKLVTGDVVEGLTEYAKAVGADLIALGSHNQGVVERLLLGSTPAELLRIAPCSVLIAPPPSTARA